MLFLQTKAGFGPDLNALNRRAIPLFNAVVLIPSSVYLGMQRVPFAFCFFQLGVNVYDVLTAGLAGHHDASGIFTTIRSSTPTTLTSRLVTCTNVLQL